MPITNDVFEEGWRKLLERFGKPYSARQAADYLEFLNDCGMSDGAFKAATRQVWATAKWFPRPADFLTVGIGGEWETVLRCMELADKKQAWHVDFALLTDRGRAACKALGGIHEMIPVRNKDTIRLKTAWEQAYEQATASTLAALPQPARVPALPAGV
jgi:hypothetical protein